MNAAEYSRRLNDRLIRYGATPLPATPALHVDLDPCYATTFQGQVAALVAASLFSRMTSNLAMRVPDVSVVPAMPAEGSLADLLLSTMTAANPFGSYVLREARPDDYRICLGPSGAGLVVHGVGWNAFVGPADSPLVPGETQNPIGAAFAVIMAGAELQKGRLTSVSVTHLVDTLHWGYGRITTELADVSLAGFDAGDVWTVGAGSVGTAALFFLSLLTRRLSVVLVDGDHVTIENVSRSPLFDAQDAADCVPKVLAAERWLRQAGIAQVKAYPTWLDELGERWLERPSGTPDVVIAAANEREVRSQIENGFPPLQLYATTGRAWQVTLLRHIPLRDACSRCLPGTEVQSAAPICASEPVVHQPVSGERVDAALPFLSYAAGLMTAAELAKASLSGYPFTPNRVFFESHNPRLLRKVALMPRAGCICETRLAGSHRQAIAGSKFAHLSAIPA